MMNSIHTKNAKKDFMSNLDASLISENELLILKEKTEAVAHSRFQPTRFRPRSLDVVIEERLRVG
jgi:hypothetical protein